MSKQEFLSKCYSCKKYNTCYNSKFGRLGCNAYLSYLNTNNF
nr:MAG TPA: FLZ zinc-finger of the FCS-type, C2-C2 [Caudoviricetes sp.]DAU96292.1 MAG TPA: FLZ zinc-finger of the FCS-type, C2-C2 [Caudoviricetes sp.]DAV76337.1 MAG TPA: FLZ zinc-finger of the FCS-type, C2-C2 [Caudoviricetes sp.]